MTTSTTVPPRPVAYRYVSQKNAHVTGIPARDLHEDEIANFDPNQLQLAVDCGLYVATATKPKKTPQKEVQVNE